MDRNKENIDIAKGIIKERNELGNRRSSILKPPRSPKTALQEACENKGEKEKRSSRRVSFADTFQIKELVFNQDGITEVNFTKTVQDKCEEGVFCSPERFHRKRQKGEQGEHFISFKNAKLAWQEDLQQRSEIIKFTQAAIHNVELESYPNNNKVNSNYNELEDEMNITKYSCNISETVCMGNPLLNEQNCYTENTSADPDSYIDEKTAPLNNLPVVKRPFRNLLNTMYNESNASFEKDHNVTRYSFDIEETTCIGEGLITQEYNATNKNYRCLNDRNEIYISFDGDRISNSIEKASTIDNYEELPMKTNEEIINSTIYIDDIDETVCIGDGIVYDDDQHNDFSNGKDIVFDLNLNETSIAQPIKKVDVNTTTYDIDETSCADFVCEEREANMHTQFTDCMEETCVTLNNSIMAETCENENTECYQNDILCHTLNKTICYNDDLSLTGISAPVVLEQEEILTISGHDSEAILGFHCSKNVHEPVVSSSKILNVGESILGQNDAHFYNNCGSDIYGEQNALPQQDTNEFIKSFTNSSIKSTHQVTKQLKSNSSEIATMQNVDTYLNIKACDIRERIEKEQTKLNSAEKNTTQNLETHLSGDSYLNACDTYEKISEKQLEPNLSVKTDIQNLSTQLGSDSNVSTHDIREGIAEESPKLHSSEKDVESKVAADCTLNTHDITNRILEEQPKLNLCEKNIPKIDTYLESDSTFNTWDLRNVVLEQGSKLDLSGKDTDQNLQVYLGSDSTLNICDTGIKILKEQPKLRLHEKNTIQNFNDHITSRSTSNTCDVSGRILEQQPYLVLSEKDTIQKLDDHLANDCTLKTCNVSERTVEKQQPTLNSSEKSNVKNSGDHLARDSASNICDISNDILEKQQNLVLPEKDVTQQLDDNLDSDTTLKICNINERILEQQSELNLLENTIKNLDGLLIKDSTLNTRVTNKESLEQQPNLMLSKKDTIPKLNNHLVSDSSMKTRIINERSYEQQSNLKLFEKDTNQKLDAHCESNSTLDMSDTKKKSLKEKPKMNSIDKYDNHNSHTFLVSDPILNTHDIKKMILEEIGFENSLNNQGIFSGISVRNWEMSNLKTQSAINKLCNRFKALSKSKKYKCRFTEDSNDKISVSYLNGLYNVEISLKQQSRSNDGFSISNINLQSHIIGKKCIEELSKYVQINFDRISVRHSSLQNIAQFLEDLSQFMLKLHPLVIDLRHVEVAHIVEFKDTLLTVTFTSHHIYQKIALTFTVDFENYPNSVIHYKYKHIGGEPFSEDTLKETIRHIAPGKNYLWRVVTAVDNSLRN